MPCSIFVNYVLVFEQIAEFAVKRQNWQSTAPM